MKREGELWPYQEDVVKYFCWAVHLAQYDDHLIIDELFELPQVTNHLHLQLRTNLRTTKELISKITHIKHIY